MKKSTDNSANTKNFITSLNKVVKNSGTAVSSTTEKA